MVFLVMSLSEVGRHGKNKRCLPLRNSLVLFIYSLSDLTGHRRRSFSMPSDKVPDRAGTEKHLLPNGPVRVF